MCPSARSAVMITSMALSRPRTAACRRLRMRSMTPHAPLRSVIGGAGVSVTCSLCWKSSWTCWVMGSPRVEEGDGVQAPDEAAPERLLARDLPAQIAEVLAPLLGRELGARAPID